MVEKLRKLRGTQGFTLLELLVVVAIIAILATLILANLNRARKQAQDAKVQSEVKSISDAIQIFETDSSANVGALSTSTISVSSTSPGVLGLATTLNQATDPLLKTVPTHPASPAKDYKFRASDATGSLTYTVAGDLVSKTGCYMIIDGVVQTSTAIANSACPAVLP